MSEYDETMPVAGDGHPWWGWSDEEREEWLTSAFESITCFDDSRRHDHDSEGYAAKDAWSPECLALGHVRPDDLELDEWEQDPYYDDSAPAEPARDRHVTSFEDELLCGGTVTGDRICTQCEGECRSDLDQSPLLWSLVALAGGDDRAE